MDTAPVILLLLGRGSRDSEAEQRQDLYVSLDFVPNPFLVDTPLGRGYAIACEVEHHDQWWTVELLESGALVTFQQRYIRVCRAYSLGIRMNDEEMKKVLGRLNEK